MKLTYGVKDKPKFGQTIIFAIQQLLAIMAATLVVPVIISTSDNIPPELLPKMSSAAALLGAGIGTLVYQLFTRFKSPVFLGSSFAFIGSMLAAFAGATTVALGYLGLIIGAVLAAVCIVWARPMMALFGASDQTLDMAVEYFVIVAAFYPFYLLFNAMNSMIRADGSPTYAMIAMLMGAVVNIVLDPVFIFGFHMGAKGAAVATVISRYVELAIVVIWTHTHQEKMPFIQGAYRSLHIPPHDGQVW